VYEMRRKCGHTPIIPLLSKFPESSPNIAGTKAHPMISNEIPTTTQYHTIPFDTPLMDRHRICFCPHPCLPHPQHKHAGSRLETPKLIENFLGLALARGLFVSCLLALSHSLAGITRAPERSWRHATERHFDDDASARCRGAHHPRQGRRNNARNPRSERGAHPGKPKG